MKPLQRTGWFPIVAIAIAGFGIGYLAQTALSASGRPPLVPPYSLPATLMTVSVIVLGFAIPLRRSVTGATKKPVNPFVAVRVIAAAKATIVSGALFFGFAAGVLLYFLLRTVAPEAAAWWPVIVTALAGIIQVAIGVIVEWLGRVPPTDSGAEQANGDDAAGAPGSLEPHTPHAVHPEAKP